MAKQNFKDPNGKDTVSIDECVLDNKLPDHAARSERIPKVDKNYVDLGTQYKLAKIIESKQKTFNNEIPIHIALKGHMGTGKDHDIEQLAAKLKYPYYRIPLSGEVRDVTLLGSVQLYGDGIGGTDSKWQDGELTRALRGPSFVNLSELNGGAHANTYYTGSNVEVSSSNKIIKMIDDSGDTQQSATQIGRAYNLVSGSILTGVYSPKTYYGRVYPEQGVIILNADTMNSELSFNSVSGSNIDGDNAFKVLTSISGAAAINANHGFAARNEERVQSTFYFVRAKNGEYNFSNNPSFVTGSNGAFRQPTFANNPKSYITTVGLYNSSQELLGVAKLSQPILKSFSNEVLVKVKLDF